MKLEKNVIIFGASTVGKLAFEYCKTKNINVLCFCDDKISALSPLLLEVPVISTKELLNYNVQTQILLSAADANDVIKNLNSIGFTNIFFFVDLTHVLFKHTLTDFEKYAVDVCIACQTAYKNPQITFLRSVDLIVTEKCSLKCKNCSNLMQYYQSPKNETTEDIFVYLDLLLSTVDKIYEFRLIGGEPLMFKELERVVQKLTQEKKVDKIVIYSNGTLTIPVEKIHHYTNNKVLFLITNYGILSKKINQLEKTLKENNIAYLISPVSGWTDCSSITKHERTQQEQKEIFQNCCAKNTFTLSKNKLFRCPFSANAHRLKAIPDFKEDYVELDKTKDIKEFLQKEFLQSCDFCNGRSFGDATIEPAIQIKKPLTYKEENYELL